MKVGDDTEEDMIKDVDLNEYVNQFIQTDNPQKKDKSQSKKVVRQTHFNFDINNVITDSYAGAAIADFKNTILRKSMKKQSVYNVNIANKRQQVHNGINLATSQKSIVPKRTIFKGKKTSYTVKKPNVAQKQKELQRSQKIPTSNLQSNTQHYNSHFKETIETFLKVAVTTPNVTRFSYKKPTLSSSTKSVIALGWANDNNSNKRLKDSLRPVVKYKNVAMHSGGASKVEEKDKSKLPYSKKEEKKKNNIKIAIPNTLFRD